MTWIQDLQAMIDRLELALPWLLPSLEAVEGVVPAGLRLLLAVPLMVTLLAVKRRQALALDRLR